MQTEAQLANLQPQSWPKGVSGNPDGRPKGSKNLSTIIKDLFANTPDWSKLAIKDIESVKQRYHNNNAWEAIVYVALSQAMTGDAAARRWLSESAFGKQINIDVDEYAEVVHIFKPEKLKSVDAINEVGAELRAKAANAVEAEVLDGMESPRGSADIRLTTA